MITSVVPITPTAKLTMIGTSPRATPYASHIQEPTANVPYMTRLTSFALFRSNIFHARGKCPKRL